MCGIAGIARRGGVGDADAIQAQKMGEIIRHRGPDDEGIRRGERYVFAHRRLAIIDLANGHQPMGNEDGTVWLAYNGEVYNFMPLREELLAKGHVFQTRCDTEVIIHLYEEEGPACVERLNGMFALALFDENNQHLLLARDRTGIKPLYYSYDGTAVRFASEAKALVQTAPRLVSPDPRSMVDFFALSVIQEGRTAFEGISELLPAHVLVWDTRGQPRTTRYWQPSYATKTRLSGEELTDAVSGLLTDAVESHLVSDVPVGTYLRVDSIPAWSPQSLTITSTDSTPSPPVSSARKKWTKGFMPARWRPVSLLTTMRWRWVPATSWGTSGR